jgi:hypothetical protein
MSDSSKLEHTAWFISSLMPDMGYMKTECNSTKDPTYKKSPRTGGSIVVSGIVLIEIFNAENLMQFFFGFFLLK